MLTDKEVGGLLKDTEFFGSDYNANGMPLRSQNLKIKMRWLIQKLVDERAMMLVMCDTKYSGLTEAIKQAKKEFDIGERSWL